MLLSYYHTYVLQYHLTVALEAGHIFKARASFPDLLLSHVCPRISFNGSSTSWTPIRLELDYLLLYMLTYPLMLALHIGHNSKLKHDYLSSHVCPHISFNGSSTSRTQL